MKILVCIKQVPDLESRFKVADQGDWYQEADLAWRMNEYDEYAVEQAVRIKEQVGDADLTVLSIGPDRVTEVIKKGLAMGCDRGVMVKDPEYFRKDPFQIASIISTYAKDKGYDLIFTGMQSQDRGSGQIGILLAEMLGITGISTIVSFAYENGTITAKRELEGGDRAVVKIQTPALVTCQLGLNTPRYPTLPNIMKAKKKELLIMAVDELIHDTALCTTEKMFIPDKKKAGLVLEGDAADLADQLITILHEKTTVVK